MFQVTPKQILRSIRSARAFAASLCIIFSGGFSSGGAKAQDSMALLGGTEWTIHQTAVNGGFGPIALEDASGQEVSNAILEHREPAGQDTGGVLGLALTFKTASSGQCVKLEIGFITEGAKETPLNRVSSDCASSPGRLKQLATVARGARAGETVVYRITVVGSASIDETKASALGFSQRWLRTRVANDTIATLDAAIRQVKARAVYASRVDWPLVSAQALACVIDGTSRRDALPGVQVVLQALGDKHSWATILDDQGRLVVNGHAIEYEAPRSRIVSLANHRVVAWLTIPKLGASSGRDTHLYSFAIHSSLSASVEAGACGYVVDLTGHTGGNMWPGLDGLGPLLGDGAVVGSFKPGSYSWQIDRIEINNRLSAAGFVDPKPLWLPELSRAPVAVVLGPMTASSGEAVAIAFSGRPNTKFFGRRSYGIATSNESVDLGDGLVAFIVVSAMADRDGKTFPGGVAPETEDDDEGKAAARALAWLSAMPSCAHSGSGALQEPDSREPQRG